jgi:hypothetical protein
MEEYKRAKDSEALKLRKKAASAEEDVKVLLIEQERYKKAANEKIRQM